MNNYSLNTKRLTIRPVGMSDLHAIYELHTLPETDQYNTADTLETIEQAELLITQWEIENNKEVSSKYIFAVVLKDTSQFIGLIGIAMGKVKYRNAEVWFKYNRKFWNKGYATEALKAIIKFGFGDLKLHRIEAGCATDNIGSYKVLEKAGMQREGRTRQLLPLQSGWADNYGYAILESDAQLW